MKVRDLLNTPLDELPKKIKVEDKTYTLFIDEDTDYHYYQDDECKYFMFSINCFEKLNDEIEVIEEQKEETKTTTRESIEALGYACGEIQKCFTNGWEKSLKNKSLNEEDKKIKRLPYYDYKETMSENNRDKFIEKLLEKHDKRLNDYHEKINEIIDYINGGRNGK